MKKGNFSERLVAVQFASGRCIASDDPRLKKLKGAEGAPATGPVASAAYAAEDVLLSSAASARSFAQQAAGADSREVQPFR